TSRRRAMAGESSCDITPDGSDLKTSWTRDSALRLTQITHNSSGDSDYYCVFYSYDSSGRTYQIKRRDDCNASSSGDTQQLTYTADGQVSEIDTYDSSST